MGKSVIGLDANLVGTVKDLAISTEGKIAIQVDKSLKNSDTENDKDLFIGADEILAIGEVVLLRHSSSLAGRDASIPAKSPTNPPTVYPTSVLIPPAYPSSTSPSSSMGNGRICSRCNFLNSSTAKFCIKCGNRMP